MIAAWLARKMDLAPLADRVATLERDYAERNAKVAALMGRVATAEASAADAASNAKASAIAATSALAQMDRQVRVLTRAVRIGVARQKMLLAADNTGGTASVETLETDIARLKAALVVAESRIEAEAEQARRAMTGLFQRIEALNPRSVGERTDLADFHAPH